jgi:signal transduction histidine kinase
VERLKAGLRAPRPGLLKASLFLGSSLLVVGLFLFTHSIIGRLTSEVQTTSHVLARFCAQASIPAASDPELQRIFSEIISGIDFPIVITDNDGTPRAWRAVGVDPELVPAVSIDSLKEGLDIAPVIRARIARVERRVKELDRRNAPIGMTQPRTGMNLGAVHYGEPEVLDHLRWMPYVSVVAVALLVLLGLSGLASIRQAEKRIIWVGMAKETAHQLGTPLSSLMGWVDLLRAQAEGRTIAPGAELDETLREMERDIDRLSKVAQRFSHVGSTPSLQPQDVTPVVRDAVEYMRRRLPSAAQEVEIEERYEPVPAVMLNRELLEWALENLLSNAISALERHPGRIAVSVENKPKLNSVEVVIRDNGRGMAPLDQRRAFEPGFTTKRRGWGLGLALGRRVVEEYHGGRLYIRESAPGEGTTMVISLHA